MKLQRLKLFAKLTEESKVWHADNECCLQKLSDEELEAVDECFESNSINEIGRSTLYFIEGYVSRKECLCDDTESKQSLEDESCEFTVQLSRGGLVHPPKDV